MLNKKKGGWIERRKKRFKTEKKRGKGKMIKKEI